jgi:histidine triad (HIT) family protein
MGNCVFCQIANGAAPASIVAETPQAMAFMDINQPVPGKVLVIPRTHVPDVYSLDLDTATAVFRLTVQVAQAVKTALQPDGLNLFQSNEAAAGQDVFHFHMHIMARYRGDHDRVRVALARHLPPRTELDQLAAQIRRHLRIVERGQALTP